jgi:Na+/H+ antiporter NhaD/arsenite permease-like protein
MSLLFTLAIFLATCIWLATEKAPRHIVVLSACLLLLFTRILTVKEAYHAINWGTLGLLLGLFVCVEVLSFSGFFDWLSVFFVQRFKSRPWIFFVSLPLLTGLFSMVINNITVMVFMTPLTLQISRSVFLDPLPLLITEACFANMMGAATLTGAPPNLLMATTLGYGFDQVALQMAPLMIASTVIFIVVYYFQYGVPKISTSPFQSRDSVSRKKFRVDVETLLFFMGLFILVGALERVGVFKILAQQLNGIHRPLLLMLAVLWISAIVSAFVDNIPMALAMAYLIKQWMTLSPHFPIGIFVWAALVGLTLGGNITPMGASPNIVVYGLLERQGLRIGWKKWVAHTVPGTLAALLGTSFLLAMKFKTGWY